MTETVRSNELYSAFERTDAESVYWIYTTFDPILILFQYKQDVSLSSIQTKFQMIQSNKTSEFSPEIRETLIKKLKECD